MGKKIVSTLQLKESDEIAEWMVNYISEQIIEAEKSEGDTKIIAQKKCFETILELWKYRANFPDRLRPFEQFEEIFRALASFDPENKYPYSYSIPENNSVVISESVKEWLQIALNIDQMTRILISYVFEQALFCANDVATGEWLNLVLNSIKSKEINVVFNICENGNSLIHETNKREIKEKIEILEQRIDVIKKFEEFGSYVREDIKEKIYSLIRVEKE